jgi:hypothetical protein
LKASDEVSWARELAGQDDQSISSLKKTGEEVEGRE